MAKVVNIKNEEPKRPIRDNFRKHTGIWIVGTIGLIFCTVIVSSAINTRKLQDKSKCKTSGKAYVEDTGACREKTTSEKFSEVCTNKSLIVDGRVYTCAELKRMGLDKAYLDNNIVTHGSTLYEGGTASEIAAGKAAGDYCLDAADTWNYIGKTRCVVFSYEYMACYNGYCFLNEKKNYTTGFVAFFGRYGMYSWGSFSATYKDGGPILVCGQIYSYQGHPEIKIFDVNLQIILHPQATKRGNSTVYRYACGQK